MAERYWEIVMEGPKGLARGFVTGFLAGLGAARDAVLDAEEEGFDVETLVERWREAFPSAFETCHLLVEERHAEDVSRAVAASVERGIRAKIVSERAISGARFDFAVTAYSEADARRIRDRLESPTHGARLAAGSEFRERRDPDARGIEVYAPTHAFELRGEGRIEGDLPAVLALLRFCRGEELVRVAGASLVGEG